MLASLIILFFFALGIFFGRAELLPDFIVTNDYTLPALWLLMFLVGLSVGKDEKLLELLRTLRPKILLMPLATTCGTFLGAILIAFFLPLAISDCLAIGSGFGYYSLSSVFITQYKGPELGSIALLANIMREIFTLLFAWPVYKLAGPCAAISCGGCTTMDTTLPILTRVCGNAWIFPAILHAMILDLTVPLWVTFFCAL